MLDFANAACSRVGMTVHPPSSSAVRSKQAAVVMTSFGLILGGSLFIRLTVERTTRRFIPEEVKISGISHFPSMSSPKEGSSIG